MDNNILEIKNVSKTLGDFQIKDLSFSLEKGYIMGLIGPNGAGKTTIIKMLMGLMKTDSGMIEMFGMDQKKAAIAIKEKIGFVYDENHYYEELNLLEMKNFIAPFYKEWDDKIFKKMLIDFELPEKKKIKNLSKGMKMKFSLALALAHDPQLIIMDEPTSGLDPVFRSEVLDILREVIQDENKAILFSSHITTDLDKIADYITFINKGQLVFAKSKEEISDEFLLVRGDQDLIKEYQLESDFIYLKNNAYRFEGLTANPEKIRLQLRDKVIYEKPSLEEIMVCYAKGGKRNA